MRIFDKILEFCKTHGVDNVCNFPIELIIVNEQDRIKAVRYLGAKKYFLDVECLYKDAIVISCRLP